MATFASFDGTELWFDDQRDDGDGRRVAVVLLHGFAADTNLNFVRSGILDALVDEGYRAVPLDFRGHGLSAKPHDPAAYADDALARDVQALLDHLRLPRVALVGYSMGAGVALQVAAADDRVARVVAIGVGGESIRRRETDGSGMRDALLADDPETITDPLGRRFRRLADSIRADRIALAACSARPREALHSAVAAVQVPVLVIAGRDDDLAGDPQVLADELADGRALTVSGDHFDATAQPALHRAVLDFVAGA